MKKLTTLIMVMAFMLASTASWASAGCTEFINFFSDKPDDHMIMLHVDMDKKDYYIVYYGKLTPNHNFSELTKVFKDLSPEIYPPNFDKVLKQYGDVADQKMLPFSWWTSPAGSTAVPSDCEAIQGGASFRCTSKRLDMIGSSNREDVIETYMGNKVCFMAADPCIIPTPYWKFKDMLARGESDDKDVSGIPDSFEVLSKGAAEAPEEEVSEPSEEITPPSDISEPSAPLTAGAPQEAMPGIPRGYDEAGACDLVPTAAVNPASYILIASALFVLVRRRMK